MLDVLIAGQIAEYRRNLLHLKRVSNVACQVSKLFEFWACDLKIKRPHFPNKAKKKIHITYFHWKTSFTCDGSVVELFFFLEIDF